MDTLSRPNRIALTRSLLALFAALTLLCSLPAAAGPTRRAAQEGATSDKYRPKLGRQASAYVKKFGLEKRTVVVEVQGQKIKRQFVPILDDAQREDFEQRFTAKRKAVLWGQGTNAEYYAKLITAPTKQFFRFNDGTNGWTVTPDKDHFHTNIGAFTKYIALELEPDKIAGLENHFATYDTQAKWKAARPGMQLKVPTDGHGECMWWMGTAEIGLNKPLWSELGIKRSVAPENIRKRLLHLGNARVSVVGVPVASLEQFRAMTDAALLGDRPMTAGPTGPVPEQ